MQIKLPCGLGLGSGGGCVYATCMNAATHVLEHHESKGIYRSGAYCMPCLKKTVRPAAQVEQCHERAILLNDSNPNCGLPDDRWKIRDFAPDELAEVEAVRAGKLLVTYQRPGQFVWEAAA